MSERANISSLEVQKRFYHPLCTVSEIERVFNPQTGADYLLALRSHYIVDHIRIYRFFLRAWRAQGHEYSLERNFSADHYEAYLEMLRPEHQHALSSLTFGDVFTKEANGEIFNSPFGRIVTISRSLKYFLEYSHLALKKLPVDVPTDVRFAAIIIALRVMFEHEALDFEVDPRGKLSEKLLEEIRRPIATQLQFIVGHEFAHHLLGHLSDSKVHDSALLITSIHSHELSPAQSFSTSQQDELSADLASLMNPEISDGARANLLNAVLIWFGALEIYEHAKDIIAPKPAWMNTHPQARERHLHLLRNVDTRYTKEMSEVSESVIQAVESIKPAVTDYLSYHIEDFETYGSVYLAAPNTEWRGRELTDRKDYY